MTVTYKNNLKKIRKIKCLDKFCGYLGPRNYVLLRKRGTLCIAPKLRGAHFEGSKTPLAQIEGSKTYLFKVIFVNRCHFRDQYNQYDYF